MVGFHFLNEGLDKLLHPRPFTAAFLESAVGPCAAFFHGLIWDPDGLYRLGYQRGSGTLPQIDMEPTKAAWKGFSARIVAHYGLDQQQQQQVEDLLQRYYRVLDEYVRQHQAEIIEYFQGIERRDRYRKDPNRTEVASLREQLARIEAQLRAKRAELLAQVDAMWNGLERDMNQLADQESARPDLRIQKLGRRWLDSVSLDAIIPWFDLSVGICLLTGTLVRLAGSLGALFLASIVVSQWPLDAQAAPTWAQGIELAAMIHLVAIGAGRWAGVDSLLGRCCAGCCRWKTGKKNF